MSNTPYSPYDQVPQDAVEACITWLSKLGYDLSSEHTEMTPYRLSWYVMNVLGVGTTDIHVTTFENDPRTEDIVIVPDIPVWSACSHHLLPFFGKIDFGYIPGDRLLGLSKIPLVVQQIARGPWVQETLTHYIADYLYDVVPTSLGVIVRSQCTHTCVMLDLDTGGAPCMVTCALRGVFAYNPSVKEEFMQHLQYLRGDKQ